MYKYVETLQFVNFLKFSKSLLESYLHFIKDESNVSCFDYYLQLETATKNIFPVVLRRI